MMPISEILFMPKSLKSLRSRWKRKRLLISLMKRMIKKEKRRLPRKVTTKRKMSLKNNSLNLQSLSKKPSLITRERNLNRLMKRKNKKSKRRVKKEKERKIRRTRIR